MDARGVVLAVDLPTGSSLVWAAFRGCGLQAEVHRPVVTAPNKSVRHIEHSAESGCHEPGVAGGSGEKFQALAHSRSTRLAELVCGQNLRRRGQLDEAVDQATNRLD